MTSWKRCVFGFGLGLGAGAPAIFLAVLYAPVLATKSPTFFHEVIYFMANQAAKFFVTELVAYSSALMLRPFMPLPPTVLGQCLLVLANVAVFSLVGWLTWLARGRLLGLLAVWASASLLLIFLPATIVYWPIFTWMHSLAWIIFSAMFFVVLRPWRKAGAGLPPRSGGT